MSTQKQTYNHIHIKNINQVLLKNHNKNSKYNRYIFSTLTLSPNLAILAACGGGGANNNPNAIPGHGFPTAISTAIDNAPQTSGFLFNFADTAATLNNRQIGPAEAYAYSNAGYFDAMGQFAADINDAFMLTLDGNNRSGGNGRDFFNGNDENNRFDGLGEADIINGNGGDDIIRGGDGADTINGNGDNDIIWGGAGADIINGGAGNDIVVLIGSVGARTYRSADFIIPSALLSGRTSDVNLASLLRLNPNYVNNIAASEFVSGETLDGGSGNNDLIIYGDVNATVGNFTVLNFGSGNIVLNSRLTISPTHLANFNGARFIGRDNSSTLMIAGNGMIDFSQIGDLDGELIISIAAGITLDMQTARLNRWKEAGDAISFSGAGTLSFDADIAAGELVGIGIDENLTVMETDMPLSGDEADETALLNLVVPANLDVGSALRADFTAPGNAENIMYEWLRDDVVIFRSPQNTYILRHADIGTTLSLRVSYNDASGTSQVISESDVVEFSAPGLTIEARANVAVGDRLTVNFDDVEDHIDSISSVQTHYFYWRRNGEIIVDSVRFIPFDDLEDLSFEYILRPEDEAAEISAVATYGDSGARRLRFFSDTVSPQAADTPGRVAIVQQARHNIGDRLAANFFDWDFDAATHTVTYRWFRNNMPVGANSDRYELTATDADADIRVEVSYTDRFNATGSEITIMSDIINVPNVLYANEQAADGAPDDLLEFIKLDNFSGILPERDAQPVQIENEGDEHGNQVSAVYRSVSLSDTALQELRIGDVNNILPSLNAHVRRINEDHEELGFVAEAIVNLQSFRLLNDDVIFIHANDRNLDLDLLFSAYPNAILLEAAGNNNQADVYFDGFKERALYEKWAAAGRVYFVGGHAEGDEGLLHDGSTHAGRAMHYYFVGPYEYTVGGIDYDGTSFAVQEVGAKVEAVYNALNHFFAPQHIDLVEVMRLLRGVAINFGSPSRDTGLGVIDLGGLLTGTDGDLARSLESLGDLRAQAGLARDTGEVLDDGGNRGDDFVFPSGYYDDFI